MLMIFPINRLIKKDEDMSHQWKEYILWLVKFSRGGVSAFSSTSYGSSEADQLTTARAFYQQSSRVVSCQQSGEENRLVFTVPYHLLQWASPTKS